MRWDTITTEADETSPLVLDMIGWSTWPAGDEMGAYDGTMVFVFEAADRDGYGKILCWCCCKDSDIELHRSIRRGG